jgi:hypothetical protein
VPWWEEPQVSRTDSDVDLHVESDRTELRHAWPVLAVISAGGVIGAEGRYGLSAACSSASSW